MLKMKNDGFTLIELAVVIAIIAILASVAIPRFMDNAAQAELATIKDFKSSLTSAAAIYTAAHSTNPVGFNSFAVSTAPPLTGANTITTYGFGSKGVATPCTVSATTVTCSGTFNKYSTVTYNWNGGQISGTATAATGNSLGNATF